MHTRNPSKPVPLPPGLSLRRRDHPLETVESRAARIDLLVAAADLEIVEGRLTRGERITLIPSTDPAWRATEAYYLLDGVLRGESPAPIRLEPGDWLLAETLRDTAIFSAETDVRFLYVTTQPSFHEISSNLSELRRLAVEVEERDGYTAGHCDRLQSLSFATGRLLGLDAQRLHLLDHGAYLHDLGKVKVPGEILRKPGKLTPDEWSIVRRHPTYGRELLEPTVLRPAGAIVEQHHERLDGSGYPLGLTGDEILVESCIVAVADAFDAMTTDRPYRRALDTSHAVTELRRFAGVHYPADVVEAFIAANCDGA